MADTVPALVAVEDSGADVAVADCRQRVAGQGAKSTMACTAPAVLGSQTVLQMTKAETIEQKLALRQLATNVSDSLASMAVVAEVAEGLEVGVDLEVAAEGVEGGAMVEGLEVAADCRQALQLRDSRR